MRAYYWRWLKTAFTHSLTSFIGTVDLWTGMLSALISVVDHFLPGLQLMQIYGWEIPIFVFAGIIALRLMLAPYWMWKADQPLMVQHQPSVAELEAQRDVWYKDAVFFLVHGKWPKPDEPIAAPFRDDGLEYSKEETKNFHQRASRILKHLKQYAYDGIYVVCGKPRRLMTIAGDVSRHGVIAPIKKDHWQDYEVGFVTMILDPQHVETSKDGMNPDRESFVSLKVSRKQTEDLQCVLRKDPIFGA